jgi:WD40 repeat protein
MQSIMSSPPAPSPREPLNDIPANVLHTPPTPDSSPSFKRTKTLTNLISEEKLVPSLDEKFNKPPSSIYSLRLFNKLGYHKPITEFYTRHTRGEALLIASSGNCVEQTNSTPFCIKSLGHSSKVAVGNEEGDILFFDSGSTGSESDRILGLRQCIRKPHSTAVKDLSISRDDNVLVSIGGDCRLQLFDLNRKQHLGTSQTGSCNKVQFHPHNSNRLLTCDRLGNLTIHDLRCPSKDAAHITQNEIPSSHYDKTGKLLQKSRTGVTSIVWCDDTRFASCCETNSEIRLWDTRYLKKNVIAPFVQKSPIPRSHRRLRDFGMVSLAFDPQDNKFWGLCKDGHVYSYYAENLQSGICDDLTCPEMDIKDFYPTISVINPIQGSNEGSYISATGAGRSAVLFPKPSRNQPAVGSPVYLNNGHSDNVGALIQQKHTGRLASIADDCNVRFWSFNEQLVEDVKGSSTNMTSGWAEESSNQY